MKWCSKVLRFPVTKQQWWSPSEFFCTHIMKPHRETVTLRCIKLYYRWSLVTDLAKISKEVYLHGLFFGEDLNLLCLSPNSGYKEVLIQRVCTRSAVINSVGWMVPFNFKFIYLLSQWNASRANKGLGNRLRIYSALCKAKAQIHCNPLTWR